MRETVRADDFIRMYRSMPKSLRTSIELSEGRMFFSVRVVKYDVNLRESSVRAVHAMHGILSHMVKFIWNDCKERLLTFYPAYFPLPSLPQLGAQDGVALCCSGICLRCQRDMGEQLKDLGGVEDLGQVVAKCFQENHMDPRFRFPWIKKSFVVFIVVLGVQGSNWRF